MGEKIYIEMFTHNGVSIRKQHVILGQDGREYEIGLPWRRAYV